MLGQGPGEDVDHPAIVPGLASVIALSAGGAHAYAIDENQQVLSWGWDAHYHLLGRGVSPPEKISGLPPAAKVVAVNENTFVLTTHGEVWACGNAMGLGLQTLDHHSS